MREIKFRAWDKEKRYMYDVRLLYQSGDVGVIEIRTDDGITPYESEEVLYKDTIELMQFTGLKDKNGKEIYEGDILGWIKTGNNKLQVQPVWYSNDDCAFMLGKRGYLTAVALPFEVIGNIYENSELIKIKVSIP